MSLPTFTLSSASASSTTTPPGAPCKAHMVLTYDILGEVATTLFPKVDGKPTTPTSEETPPPSPPYDGPLSPYAMNRLLSQKDRDYQSPQSSPPGSPVCPGAPRAPRVPAMSFGKALAAL